MGPQIQRVLEEAVGLGDPREIRRLAAGGLRHEELIQLGEGDDRELDLDVRVGVVEALDEPFDGRLVRPVGEPEEAQGRHLRLGG